MSGGSSRPEVLSTLEFFLIWSSLVKYPLNILFSIFPYSGSSLNQCSLSKMITALMQFSQCWLDRLENRSSVSLAPTDSSCLKSQANIFVNPLKGFVLSLISFSFLSSVFRIVSLMNDTSSNTTIQTSCHSFLSSTLSCLRWLRNAALEIVTPPKSDAAEPVYAVNMNVLSLYIIPTAIKNS